LELAARLDRIETVVLFHAGPKNSVTTNLWRWALERARHFVARILALWWSVHEIRIIVRLEGSLAGASNRDVRFDLMNGKNDAHAELSWLDMSGNTI
jgi:hypothetical protein